MTSSTAERVIRARIAACTTASDRAGRSSEEADVLLVAASTRASSVARACSAWPKSLWQSADASHASTRS